MNCLLFTIMIKFHRSQLILCDFRRRWLRKCCILSGDSFAVISLDSNGSDDDDDDDVADSSDGGYFFKH